MERRAPITSLTRMNVQDLLFRKICHRAAGKMSSPFSPGASRTVPVLFWSAMFWCLVLSVGRPAATEPESSSAVPPKIKIALYKGPGTGGAGPIDLLKQLNSAGASTSLVEITPEEIRAGALTNFDVVIFAGGSGSQEAKAIGETGRDEVRKFVANGGGYIGICAGAYLATMGYPWSLHIINARTLSSKWRRGRALLKMELTPAGANIFSGPTNLVVLYHQGPVVGPANATNLPPYEALAYFRSEVASNDTPKGIMINSPAIFAGTYQKGRIVCISPHPEQTDGLEYVVSHAVSWVAPTLPITDKKTPSS